MLLPYLHQSVVSFNFLLVDVLWQELGQKNAIVARVLYFINCQVGQAVAELDFGFSSGACKSQEKNPELCG